MKNVLPLEDMERSSGIQTIRPETDPRTLSSLARDIRRIQFDDPLPTALLDAIAATLQDHPELRLRVYGRSLDTGLSFLSGFGHVRNLYVDLWYVQSFDPLRRMTGLRELGVGETKSRTVSLAFLDDLPLVEKLSIEGHDRGFSSIAGLTNLERLSLRASRVKSLDVLAGHAALERVWVSFGGMRNFAALASLPNLRDLSLHRIRLLGDRDLSPLAKAARLEAVELQDLRGVTTLASFGSSPSIRLLHLEGLSSLHSLEALASWPRLEHLRLTNTRPADRQLKPLLRCPRLRIVEANHRGPIFDGRDIHEFLRTWKGDAFWYRGEHYRGSRDLDPLFWRVVDRFRETAGAA